MKRIIVLAAICLLPFSACADGFGVSAKVGTLGAGLDLDKSFGDSLTGRIGFNKFTRNTTAQQSTVTYNLGFKLQTVEALVDWFPFHGGFRTTLGVMYDQNKINLAGTPTGGNFIINGATYTAAQVGSLDGQVSFNKTAPYLGIGWGNPVAKGKGWGFVADLGVLFQGSPKVALNATCGSAIAGTAQCTQLQTDAQAEAANVQSSLSKFKTYPVASVGLSYQF